MIEFFKLSLKRVVFLIIIVSAYNNNVKNDLWKVSLQFIQEFPTDFYRILYTYTVVIINQALDYEWVGFSPLECGSRVEVDSK